MVRYTLMRLLIFFGFVLLFWLLGMRDESEMGRLVLVGSAALASAAASYLLLRGMRDDMTARLVARHEARLQSKQQGFDDDDGLAEDAEIERDR